MYRFILKAIGIATLALTSMQAAATADWVDYVGHVTEVEVTSMGSPSTGADAQVSLVFTLDAAVGTGSGCAAGDKLFWIALPFSVGTSPVPNDKQMENARAVMTVLLLSVASGNKVRLSGMNKSSGYCQILNVTILNTY